MNQIEKIIDIATWNRKEHFEHFSAFDDPFFGVTVHVDCTRSYQEAKDKGVSFSLLLLHRIITAASKVEEFRYRIEGASPIIARYLDDAEKEAAQRMAAAPK